jgi:hypothetical protein
LTVGWAEGQGPGGHLGRLHVQAVATVGYDLGLESAHNYAAFFQFLENRF